jgi:quinol monooxygenase YgiN
VAEVLIGSIDCDEDSCDAFVEHLRALVKDTNLEPGCLWFRATADLDDDSRYHVAAAWVDSAARDEHRRSEHLRTFLRDGGALVVDSRAYRVKNTRVGPAIEPTRFA